MRSLSVALAILAAGICATAQAGDFIDTRLSFVLADDNVLAKAGETNPSSPNVRFGAGAQNNQFYDNFNTRFSGFETLSNLVLYKSMPAFFEGLTTEASFNVLVLEKSSGGIDLRDNSSYIRIAYRPASWGAGENLSLTGFPVSADRFRLGYAYRITWGGTGVFTNRAFNDGVPGVKLQVTKERWYAFIGAKTALILNELPFSKEKETNYGYMAGAGVDLLENTLRLEVNGGYFQKGNSPGLASQSIEAPVNALGASAQVVYHRGEPVGTSVDLRLYRNDPDMYERFFRPERYPGGFSFAVSFEASSLVQTLEDPDVFARTVLQPASAAALQARFKYNFLRWHVLALYRTLSFIQFDVPGFPPYKDFPDGTVLSPEMFVAMGFDYHFPRIHFTPGFIFGVQQPASFRSPDTVLGGNAPAPGFTGSRTVVVREANLVTVLPSTGCGANGDEACSAEPIFSAKATFRFDLSEMLAAIGEVYYTRDRNKASFVDDVTGATQQSFEKEHGLGFNIMLQARY